MIESQYKRLLKMAQYATGGDDVWAQELLHDTILLLLEGRHNIDFNRFPMTYVQIMMRFVKGEHKRIKQKNFNRTTFIAYDPRSPTIERYMEGEEGKQTPLEFLLDHFHELKSVLTPRQVQIIEWYLDGHSYRIAQKQFGISNQRVSEIFIRAKEKLRKKGLILLQADSSNDRGL